MQKQRCCVHCPGKSTVPGRDELHECCQPKYVTGNLKISSLRGRVPSYPKTQKQIEGASARDAMENSDSCYDKFALAKKLHAENLEHQPLPDKVDDSVFKNPRAGKARSCRNTRECRCKEHRDRLKRDAKRLDLRYGPVLGCKKPETRMDLAICWETPTDPIYEPPRATHIDGSEGGLAPAIFALVQHTPNSTSTYLRSENVQVESQKDPRSCCGLQMENVQVKNEEKNRCSSCRTEVRNDIHVKNQEGDRGSCCDARVENRSSSRIMKDDDEEREKEDRRILKNHWCCECLCEDMKTMEISGEQRAKSRTGRKVRKEEDPRLIKSAVGIALGLQKSGNNDRRNGLPTKKIVPRPRTPFARRSFCIDTLAPPFSIVNGCRDADYPEHWRLMSIYQQSYKNPQKRKGTNH